MVLSPELEAATTINESTDLVQTDDGLAPELVQQYESQITKDFSDAMDMWKVDGSSGSDEEKTPYADWTGILKFVLTSNYQTIDDFFPDAVIEDPDVRELLVRLVDLGRRQFHAYVNNRLAIVEDLRAEISIILSFMKGQDPDTIDGIEDATATVRTTLIFLSTINVELRMEKSQSMVIERQRRLGIIQRQIQRDQAEGHFNDYTEIKRILGDKIVNVTDVMNDMPEFLQMANTYAKSTQDGTRRPHFQAIIARLLDNNNGGSNHGDQRKLQSMIRSRGGNGQEYDLSEDNF